MAEKSIWWQTVLLNLSHKQILTAIKCLCMRDSERTAVTIIIYNMYEYYKRHRNILRPRESVIRRCSRHHRGSGFTKRQLERARQFYRTYPNASALRPQFNWTQYKILISISDHNKREYYELESVNNCCTDDTSRRQHHHPCQQIRALSSFF